MSSFSLPSDKFYFRDKETEEPIDLWTPYAGLATYAEFASAPTGTLATTITTLESNITTLESNVTTLESSVSGISTHLTEFENNVNAQITGISTNIQNNMNRYLEGYIKVHTHQLGTPWENNTLSAGLYELRLNCINFGARLVFFYDKVESLGLNQVVFSPDTNIWYAILFDITVGSQTPPLSDSSIEVIVQEFDSPGSGKKYTSGNWELYRLASIK